MARPRHAGWFWKVRNDLELTLLGDDSFDDGRAEGADQLVLEVLDADIEAELFHSARVRVEPVRPVRVRAGSLPPPRRHTVPPA